VAATLETFAGGARLRDLLDGEAGEPSPDALPSPSHPTIPELSCQRRRRHRLLAAGGSLAAALAAIVPLVMYFERPARIESLDLIYYRDRGGKYVVEGMLDSSHRVLPPGSAVRVLAKLNRPGYCYLLLLKPDGTTKLCLPASTEEPATATAAVDFPPQALGPLEGEGQFGVVLVVSGQPLPPFREWHRRDALPWQASRARTAWKRLHGKLAQLGADRDPVEFDDSPARKLDQVVGEWSVETGFLVFPVEASR
jgi:hypothetical protein